MVIIDDVRGNQLLDLFTGNEDELINNLEFRPLPSSLVIVKSPKGFMLLKNRYRNEWELAGGMIDGNETPKECAIRECFEESGYLLNDIRFVGMMKFFMRPSFHWNEERIEYTALYCAEIETIKDFTPNDEMSDICWFNIGEQIENANRIDLKLLEYYFAE